MKKEQAGENGSEQRFEDQLEQLERIVARLEDESVGLEEAIDLFEKGMGLARRCRGRLEEVEQRVERLLATEDELTTEPLQEPES